MAATETKRELNFLDFCKVCEKISKCARDKKGDVLRKFIHEFRLARGGKEFYPVLRLLLPQLDRERGPYGLKEHGLAQKYIKVLSIPKESNDAKKLLHFRTPRTGSISGDFGEVVYWVIKNRHSGGGEITVEDVNLHLENIADKHASHEPRAVDDELIWMVQRMSPLEIKWLTRILIKDMKLGIGHKGILKSYHPDAVELYDVSNNLCKICEKLNDPLLRLHEVEVSLFNPFRPMLAERCDVQKVERELSHGTFHLVETKWDGERSQIHFHNGEFKYYSRKGFDYTDSFGANSSVGSLTPRLANQIKPTVQSFILDGEMMAWNTKYKSFGSKGANIEVKSLRLGSAFQPCFCAFDILYLNGVVLTNKPFSERIKLLSTVFTPLEGVFIQTTNKVVKKGNEVMKLLNDAIDNREEGIILKHPDSVYKPNVRNGGWYKIKPEYTEGAMSDLDLLIIGGYYGEGRRRGFISQFLLGLAVPSKTPGEDPEQFLAVCRVGSGCTMGELAELGKKLSAHWNRLKSKAPPTSLRWTKEKPELWIEPSLSVILQIKASEIVYSDAYPVKYSLRFPRIEKVRYDKRWQDCLTISEFEELRTAASGKLISSHIKSEEKPEIKAKRLKLSRTIPSVGNEFLSNDFSNIKQLSKVLDGKEICIIIGNIDYSKKILEAKVVENGGRIVQNPGLTTSFVVSGDTENIKIKNIEKSGRHDVVTVEWLNTIIDAQEMLDFKPEDLICMSRVTGKKMKLLYDKFGDSYTKPATINSLKESFNKVKILNEYKRLERNKLAELDTLLFKGPSPFAIFRHCTAFFFNYKVSNLADNIYCPLKFSAINFLSMGGKIVDLNDDDITHAVIHSSDEAFVNEIKNHHNGRAKKFFVVNENWIMESWKSRSCLDETLFLL